MATHSTILVWRIPWTEEPGRLHSMGLQRVGHDWATFTFTFGPEMHGRLLQSCASSKSASLRNGSQIEPRTRTESESGVGVLQSHSLLILLLEETQIHRPPETPILRPPGAKNWLIGKDRDAGEDWRQKGKGTTDDEMVGWHHWLDGHELEQALGIGDGQGSLRAGVHGVTKSQTWLSDWTELNWTELKIPGTSLGV